MRLFSRLTLVAILVVLNTFIVHSQLKKLSPNPFAGFSPYLNEQLNRQLDDRIDPGIAVSIISDQQVQIRNIKGVDDLSSNELLSASTSFYLASVTKPMTAQLVRDLVAKNKVQLSQKVPSLLPNMPNYMDQVTVKDLLLHQSGIPDYYQFITWREPIIDNDHVFKLLMDSVKNLNFSPGTKYEYSNANYILLATIIEKLTGTSYPEMLSSVIFDSFNMYSSSVGSPKKDLRPAVGYNYKNDVFLMNDYKSIEFPNGFVAPFNKKTYGSSGVFSTLADLERWILNLYEIDYFQNIEDNNIQVEQVFESPVAGVTYMDGWLKGSLLGYDVFWHSGGFGGYRNVVVCVPEIEFAIIALSNNGRFDAEKSGLQWAQKFVGAMK